MMAEYVRRRQVAVLYSASTAKQHPLRKRLLSGYRLIVQTQSLHSRSLNLGTRNGPQLVVEGSLSLLLSVEY
jgi:hypothetical protein